MAPPISFGLGLSLARAGGAALDADAAAYIAAVETAGATVSGTQKAAIDTFFKTGKSDGWYSSIKRLYLPIWAAAAPNAVDMVTRASGTFSGTVTHSAGYVQSDGTSGFFTTTGSMSADGLTTSSGMMFVFRKSVVRDTALGTFGNLAPGRCLILPQGTNKVRTDWGDTSNIFTTTTHEDNVDGVFVSTRTSTGIRHTVRTSSTRLVDSGTVAASGTILSGLAKVMNIAAFWDASHFCAAGWGLELSDTDEASFTLALKNLWETSTGLTLP